jgi:hypothetical protein
MIVGLGMVVCKNKLTEAVVFLIKDIRGRVVAGY